MDPKTLVTGDRITHPDFGGGEVWSIAALAGHICIEWDRQGQDAWALGDKRWEQVELA